LNENKVRVLFITISTILLIIVLGFTGALNIMSFEKNYSESLISSYTVLGGETVGKIEYAIKYGKPLDSFWGMDKLLAEIMVNSTEIDMVQVVSNNGQVLYDQEGIVYDGYIPESIWKSFILQNTEGENNFAALEDAGKYYLFLPIVDRDNQYIGNLNIIFDESVINSVVKTYQVALIKYLVLMVMIGFIVFTLVFMRVSFSDHNGRVKRKTFIVVILVVLGFLQIIYGLLNYNIFKKAYLEVAHNNTVTISKVIQNDVNSVITKGIPYNELYNIQDYLQRIITTTPEIENIHIYENYTPRASKYMYIQELATDLHGKRGSVGVEISQKNIAKKLQNILLDTITVLVISFLLMVEVTLFLIVLIEKRFSKGMKIIDSDNWNRQTIPMVRYLAFLVFLAGYMSTSFIPILMNNLYEPILSLPKNVVLGLPISVEMFFGALAAVGAGYSIDKKGCKSVLLKGVLIFCMGAVISAIARDPIWFIVARSIAGAGFGLALMALRTIVISTSDPLFKNQGIAAMNSGAFAGVNCGVIIGAMLADRIGYSQVFFVACAIIIIAFFAACVFIENVMPIAARKQVSTNQSKTSKFILDKDVLSFFIFVLIPFSICGRFLNYLFPIFAESRGVSSANVGRAFLINGLIIIYLGPILSRISEKYLGTKKSLVLASLIIGISMLIFASFGTLAAAFATVILLGLADSFGVAAQSNYFLGLRAVSSLGEGKAIAYFSIVGKLGQMLGPFAFGSLAAFGMVKGVGVVGVVALITFLIFAKSNKKDFEMNNS
jgi:predicted MFS family arabinose efflux permease